MGRKNEDDMGGQSFFINDNSAVGFSSILQTEGFVVGVGRVGKGFLGYHQVPIRSNVIHVIQLDSINNYCLIYTSNFKHIDFGFGTKNP